MVIALRQLQDELVRLGLLRRIDDGGVDFLEVGFDLGIEAADILLDRAGEQPRILRQEADMPGQPLGIPIGHVRAVQAHRPAIAADCAGDQARQRGLAGAARPDDRHDLACFGTERQAVQDGTVARSIEHDDLLELDRTGGGGELGRRAGIVRHHQQARHRVEAAARADDRLPGADQLLDR